MYMKIEYHAFTILQTHYIFLHPITWPVVGTRVGVGGGGKGDDPVEIKTPYHLV